MLPKDFETQLEAVYQKYGLVTPHDFWIVERDDAIAACEAIAAHPELIHYEVLRPLAIGGGGITLVVSNKQLQGRLAVLKLPRPVRDAFEKMNQILLGEATKLIELNHERVIRIYESGTARDSSERPIPYYIMEFLEGSMNALDFVHNNPNEDTVISVLSSVAEGLDYLHNVAKLVHTDIKPDNIFCDIGG